jgi:ubiquinone/menaquinone biosynthesis C-methylase UbiE
MPNQREEINEVMDNASDRGQVTGSAAEVYEEFFIPALFREWATLVADAAQIQPSWRVLDVACGTGIVARTIVERVGSNGTVVGLDINEGMLQVARRKAPTIEWRQGPAEALPFDTHSFDAAICQFGLMFFADRRAALQEMIRVLRPGGHLVVAVWDSVENTPGYTEAITLMQRLFGAKVADALRAPFVLGDPQLLRALFTEAGIPNAKITAHQGTAHFPSIRSWMYTDIKGWTMADMVDDEQFELLCREAEQLFQRYLAADGSVSFSTPGYIITATKA